MANSERGRNILVGLTFAAGGGLASAESISATMTDNIINRSRLDGDIAGIIVGGIIGGVGLILAIKEIRKPSRETVIIDNTPHSN